MTDAKNAQPEMMASGFFQRMMKSKRLDELKSKPFWALSVILIVRYVSLGWPKVIFLPPFAAALLLAVKAACQGDPEVF
jgi:hypothetical protein